MDQHTSDLVSGRVTAGLPALTAVYRHAREAFLKQRSVDTERLREKIAREEATVKPDGGVSVANPEAQLGRSMTAAEFKRLLLSINRNFRFEVSHADATKTGIYIVENRGGKPVKRFICGMQSNHMPEFSIIAEETKRIPDPDVPGHWQEVPAFQRESARGWRTVLARLIHEKLVTTAQAERLFKVNLGRSSEKWQTITR